MPLVSLKSLSSSNNLKGWHLYRAWKSWIVRFPRDECSVTKFCSRDKSRVRDFWKFPEKWEKPTIFPKNTKIFHTFSKKFVIFPRFWGLLLVIFVIFRVFFCSWFLWLFCLEVGIFKKNHLGTLLIFIWRHPYST